MQGYSTHQLLEEKQQECNPNAATGMQIRIIPDELRDLELACLEILELDGVHNLSPLGLHLGMLQRKVVQAAKNGIGFLVPVSGVVPSRGVRQAQ
jgi:hypothetical protein